MTGTDEGSAQLLLSGQGKERNWGTLTSLLRRSSSMDGSALPSSTGVSNLVASLHHTGRKVVLGHALNTLRHITTKKPHNVLSKFTTLCWAEFTAIPGCMRPADAGWTPRWATGLLRSFSCRHQVVSFILVLGNPHPDMGLEEIGLWRFVVLLIGCN